MKITGSQMFWVVLTMDLGMTLVMTLGPGFQFAKQDLWISMLLSGAIALLVTLLVTNVALHHPGKDLIAICRAVLGKWLGGAVILAYMVQWYTILPIVLRQFADAINIMTMPRTPKLAIIVVMVLLISYVTYSGGIVTISRCSEILGPIILLMIVLVLASSINGVRLANLLPVFSDTGALNIAKGAIPSASYLGHSVEYLMLAAFLYQPRKGPFYTYMAVATASVVVLVAMIMVIATIGVNLTPSLWYPFFEMTRKISLFGFIENLDPFTVVTWVASVFIKLSVYLFIISYGTAQFLNVRRWRILIFAVAPIAVWFAMIPSDVTEATTHYLQHYWVPIVLPINMLGLPMLLLIVGKWRGKIGQESAN